MPVKLLIALIAAGGYAAYLYVKKQRALARLQPQHRETREDFVARSRRYPLDFDRCTFKDSSFVMEVEEDMSNARLAAYVAGGALLSYGPQQKEQRVQSVLFYSDPEVLGGKRLHQTFPLDATMLKFHVLQGNVALYVTGGPEQEYAFLLERS